ncbi:hypothetical protein CAC42_5297 [Sphaceloma murrayae]|uniref:RRM domain-containing protein n=1 Tax=Sphaceloma murrayae TaxID=2082308 RepID=A0A2K1QUL4_9PEZI|nr:hypothetical protein CAC42_5297 [Sphaceloma murrayae]
MPSKPTVNGTQAAPHGTAGIINVNPAAIQPQANKPSARLKVLVRRLPPGLTQEEFQAAFGDEWKVGSGKVDWIEYRQGKIRSPGKQPEQSRCYVHFLDESQIRPFEAKFLSITFHDVKGTHRHPELKHLPPMLEFAPLQRVPIAKPRIDTRQGTVDQDPEYMAFLESETMALPKAAAIDSTLPERTKETVTSTPLIEALREKKAAKAKAAAAKATKQSQKADETGSLDKPKPVQGKTKKGKEDVKPSAKDGKNKEATKTAAREAKPTSNEASSAPAGTASPPTRKRERAPANIKTMLQRDLGLAPSNRRGAREPSSSNQGSNATTEQGKAPPTEPSSAVTRNARARREAPAAAKPAPSESAKNPPAQASPRAPKSKTNPGPAVNSNSATATPATASANATQTARPMKAPSKPSPGATKAYLKHANASQGITEELLRGALTQFGDIVSLEIDKRKGTALAEYKTPEALAAAMAKRSVPVAQGAVEVLEFKEKPTGAPRSAASGRGTTRGHRGRGGSRGVSGGASSPAAAGADAAG